MKFLGGFALLAIIAINVFLTNNISENGSISLFDLNQASASDFECSVIVTPDGGGTEGAELLHMMCDGRWVLIKWEAFCVWTGNCEDICWFNEEHDCQFD